MVFGVLEDKCRDISRIPCEPLSEHTISASKFFNVLQAAQLTNFMPDHCLGLKTKKLLPCKIKVEKATVKIGKFQDPAFDLIFAAQGFAPVKIRTYVGKSVELSASVDSENKTVYTFSFADMTNHFKIGDRFYSGLILLRKANPPSSDMTIDSIIVKPGIVTSIDTSKNQVCHLGSPYVSNFLDDTILARKGNPGRPSSIEEGLSWIEPFAGCFPNNLFPQ